MEDWQLELSAKSANLETIQFYLQTQTDKLATLVLGLTSPDDTYRYNSFMLCQQICKVEPEILYPYWPEVEAMLPSENNYHRSIAILLLGALCPADSKGCFELIADRYFSYLNGGSVMTARYIVQSCTTIFRSKPALRTLITDILLHIENYCNLPPERIDLLRTDILDCLEQLYPLLTEKDSALRFAEAALSAKSPKTCKTAKLFLKKHVG
ncbi:MAG: hypothetical protein CVU39_17180 [Chloroflexi bacterium HGW-Chloroflexi-10]|nr:MAG: hypothetical protein CVU39_17180 [Chloroflexi bacterium HGW-Chloroflexi-10]